MHDVPHTAFSHVVDFVMEDHDQEYHDRFLEHIVLNSEIPEICGRHGIDIRTVLKKEHYPLLDNHTPELSFDRWDYFMRDAHQLGILPLASVGLIISSAKLKDGQFYFDDLNVASQLCLTSLMVCQLGYISATSHGSWFLLAEALKAALSAGVITEDDLFTTDQAVWDKLTGAQNDTIDGYIRRLQPGREFLYAAKEDAEFYGRNKARYIDPLVLRDGTLHRTSGLVTGLEAYIADFTQKCRYIGVRQTEVPLPQPGKTETAA